MVSVVPFEIEFFKNPVAPLYWPLICESADAVIPSPIVTEVYVWISKSLKSYWVVETPETSLWLKS